MANNKIIVIIDSFCSRTIYLRGLKALLERVEVSNAKEGVDLRFRGGMLSYLYVKSRNDMVKVIPLF